MRVIAGPEKKTRVMSEKERRVTAFHEMGHALVAHYLENTDPVHKISVISRGQALGYTISLPTEDKFLTTRAELSDTMAMTLGGRAAEEIVFGEVTTGASNDLEKVTATAKQMVMRFGMSEKLGPRVFGHDHGQPFLGREFSLRAGLLGRDRPRDRRRDPPHRRGGAPGRARMLERAPRGARRRPPRSCSAARRSSASSSSSCSRASPRTRSSAPRSRPSRVAPPAAPEAPERKPHRPPRRSCPARAWQEAPPRCAPTRPRAPRSPSAARLEPSTTLRKGSDPFRSVSPLTSSALEGASCDACLLESSPERRVGSGSRSLVH